MPPPNHYRDMGRSRSDAKVAAARENGKRGGRKQFWSQEARTLAATWIRQNVDSGNVPEGYSLVEMDLKALADALESGAIRHASGKHQKIRLLWR